MPPSITIPLFAEPGKAFPVLWGASSGVVGHYQLQEGYSTSYALPTTWATIYTGLDLSFTVAAKASNTYVAYRVRACNSAGCSGFRTSEVRLIQPRVYPLSARDPMLVVGLYEQAE